MSSKFYKLNIHHLVCSFSFFFFSFSSFSSSSYSSFFSFSSKGQHYNTHVLYSHLERKHLPAKKEYAICHFLYFPSLIKTFALSKVRNIFSCNFPLKISCRAGLIQSALHVSLSLSLSLSCNYFLVFPHSGKLVETLTLPLKLVELPNQRLNLVEMSKLR
jgi:hypothetical protein